MRNSPRQRPLEPENSHNPWPEVGFHVIVLDNGPEFTSRAFDQWAYQRGIELRFIQPGKPAQNAFVESFNGKFRDECLNANWFVSLADAIRVISAWRTDYNRYRPHGSLGRLTPEEFARKQVA